MTRQNRILAALVAVVAVLAVVAAIVAATRQAPDHDPATPEGVVQGYLSAVIDRDLTAATGYLDADGDCDVADFDHVWIPDGVRAVLGDVAVDGDTARVVVDLAVSSGGLLDGSEYTEKQTFRLSRTGEGWSIGGSPWPLHQCGLEG